MIKLKPLILAALLLSPPLLAVPPPGSSTKKNVIESEAGLNIPAVGFGIDMTYDERLDDLIPGYKIVNVLVTNKSADTVIFDPKKDKWYIVDNLGKEHKAYNHVEHISKDLWNSLPEGLREHLAYPTYVKKKYSAKIDLLFPNDVDLKNFRQLIWKPANIKKTFNIYPASDKNMQIKSKTEPQPITIDNIPVNK